ncbi:FkbM family methyltransferase [Arcticibacter tournemirensis]|nr:FkbM family methyltransferase [Arcticibacter tournemirensis]
MNIIDKLAYKIRSRFSTYISRTKNESRRRKILRYFRENNPTDPEIKGIIDFLKRNPLGVFLNSFKNKYQPKDVKVFKDTSNDLFWVDHYGKRLYFKRSYNITTIRLLYNGLLTEQDPESPHCYVNEDFNIKQGDVLLDIGSAEGIFTLSNIEQLKKAILFERDPEWIEALEATFAPWKEKVEIISKFVSDTDDLDNVSIDTFLSEKQFDVNFVKIDVEGAEERVLNGMRVTIGKCRPQIALCTYHKQHDFEKFNKYLTQLGYKISSTKGYMFFLSNDEVLSPPFFRRGLIRAVPNY